MQGIKDETMDLQQEVEEGIELFTEMQRTVQKFKECGEGSEAVEGERVMDFYQSLKEQLQYLCQQYEKSSDWVEKASEALQRLRMVELCLINA